MRRVFAALLLAGGLMPLCVAARLEDDPHYKPVKAVGQRTFTVQSAQGSGVIRYFGTGSLDAGSKTAARALINISGLLRNSDVYERTGEKAIFAADAASDTILITPQFLAQVDITGYHLPAETLRWEVQTWLDGSPALGPSALSSFDVLDAIIQRLADSSRFPALREIVLIGHSAGGQLVQRYAVVGRAPDAVTLPVRYVVANPSSYLYFDRERPVAHAGCAKFDDWKYGFENVPPYVNGSPSAYENRYVQRNVTYLLGRLDTDPHHPVLDRSCPGEAEGAFRLARGRNYVRYLEQRHPSGTKQTEAEVAGVDHDGDAMFTSACGVAVIFERPRTPCAHNERV